MPRKINQSERSTEGQNRENKGNKTQQQSQENAGKIARTLGKEDTRSLGQKMADIDKEYAAFVASKAHIINDPVTIAVNTIKNMRQEPLSPRNFRNIEFHDNF